ncbi:MAG: DUF11 domain-containing protein [Deltaproteobacteria bacterium]|nr:DUF11 domain-containing protein [Deltaproteobacteria bacterium]
MLNKNVKMLSLGSILLLGIMATVPASSQQVVESFQEYADASNPVLPPAGENPGQPTVTGDGLTFYTDRATFQGDCPDLPLEDFSNTLVPPNGVLACTPGPLNSSTNNNCFATGGVIDGFTMQSAPVAAEDLVVTTPPFLGTADVGVGPNTFVEDVEILFSPAITGFGSNLIGPLANFNINIDIFDEADMLIGSTTSAIGLPSVFWGVTSTVPIGRIAMADPAGNGELFSLMEFGSCVTAMTQLMMGKTGVDNGDGTGVYTLTVTNNGPDDEPNATVVDSLPAGVTYVSDDCGAAFADPVLTWNVGALAFGASAVCNVTVDIIDPSDTTNVATVTGLGDPTGTTATSPLVAAQVVPTLGWQGMLVLLLGISAAAFFLMRRRSNA